MGGRAAQGRAPWRDTVGKSCRVCGEAITAGGQGVQVYSVSQDIGLPSERVLTPIHREHIDRFLEGGKDDGTA